MRFLFSSLLLVLLTISVGGQMSNLTDCGISNHPAHENFIQQFVHFLQDKLSRIIGGNDAPVGKWPWQVKVIMNRLIGDIPGITPSCGGSIIADRWILTAAHCFSDLGRKIEEVMFGSVISAETNKTMKPKSLNLHEEWSEKNNYHNDIALIELEEPITFDETASPVCLPSINTTIPRHAQVIATGFGLEYNWNTSHLTVPQQLLETVIPLVPIDVCSKLWNGTHPHINGPLFDTQLCGGTDGRGTAEGDSGGPLVIYSKSGRWFEVGLTSFGRNDKHLVTKQDLHPGVFTNVQKYCDWIEENTRGEATCRDGELIDAKPSSTAVASMSLALLAFIAYSIA